MKRQRLYLLGLMLALLLLVGACGGGDDERGERATTAGGTTAEENVSGNVSVIGVWTGPEQESFQAVIDGFTTEYPDVTVKYTSGGDNIVTVLSTAVEGGNPPDVATVSQPGMMADFVKRGALKPLDFAQDAVTENFGESIVTTGSVDGKLYGLLFKAANKSTIWYNVKSFEDAGVEAPATYDDLLGRREDDQRVRRCPHTRSAVRTAGRSPTCSRTSTSARRAPRRTTSSPSTRSPGPTSRSRTRWRRWRRSSATRTTSPAARREPCRPTSRPRCRTSSRRRRRRRWCSRATSSRASRATPTRSSPRPGSTSSRSRRSATPARPSSAAATSSSCSRRTRRREAFIEYLTDAGGLRDLGQARRVLVPEQERRRERLSRPDPADDRRRDRRGGHVPLRPLRPAAVRVRRHRRPGPLQAVPGLPEEPDRHRRDHEADGGRGREGVRLEA